MTEAEEKSSAKAADCVTDYVTDCTADTVESKAADADCTADCIAGKAAECAAETVESEAADAYSVTGDAADCEAAAAASCLSPGRPTWDEYFMAIANLAGTRSTCRRRQVGAVLVRDRHIIATGYNGAPEGLPHCLEVGCLREDLQVPSGQRHEMCIGVHAEQNLLIQAALAGSSPEGATLYCTHQPCIICAKMLINARIKRVVFQGDYPDALSRRLLSQAGVEFMRYSNR